MRTVRTRMRRAGTLINWPRGKIGDVTGGVRDGRGDADTNTRYGLWESRYGYDVILFRISCKSKDEKYVQHTLYVSNSGRDTAGITGFRRRTELPQGKSGRTTLVSELCKSVSFIVVITRPVYSESWDRESRASSKLKIRGLSVSKMNGPMVISQTLT